MEKFLFSLLCSDVEWNVYLYIIECYLSRSAYEVIETRALDQLNLHHSQATASLGVPVWKQKVKPNLTLGLKVCLIQYAAANFLTNKALCCNNCRHFLNSVSSKL